MVSSPHGSTERFSAVSTFFNPSASLIINGRSEIESLQRVYEDFTAGDTCCSHSARYRIRQQRSLCHGTGVAAIFLEGIIVRFHCMRRA
jgi:hypothetical protein